MHTRTPLPPVKHHELARRVHEEKRLPHLKVENARPTSWQCEAYLKKIWVKLKFPLWDNEFQKLPKPKRTPLQKYNPHELKEFYYDHMETAMLNMMIGRYKRLLGKVDMDTQKKIIKEEIVRLREKIQEAQTLAKDFRHLNQKEHFQKQITDRRQNHIKHSRSYDDAAL